MNIKILDSWLRDYLKTKAQPKIIAEKLSLASVSVERLEKFKNDFSYDIEVTTNRPDLMSVTGLARESAAVLRQNKIDAEYIPPNTSIPKIDKITEKIEIKSDQTLVNRICAAVLEVKVKPSSEKIKERLEAGGMRSLNNLIDITNYITRTIGHSSHVFDFDRLDTEKLIVTQSKPGDKIVTLDKKTYTLSGGDIVAIDDRGRIVDLLGIMGLENSVVTNNTKKILFFLNNNDPVRMRRTSMELGIRTEAVILNEKSTDPELAWSAFLYGIKLFEEMAEGKVVSELIDIYPNKIKTKEIEISEEKINSVIGADIPLNESAQILESLGFEIKMEQKVLKVIPPSFRNNDIEIAEDLIEEIARIYGYHNLPSIMPPVNNTAISDLRDAFYWENRTKDALKFWGFTECYTYSMVSGRSAGEKETDMVKIKNPLDEDHVFMRTSIVPSLVEVAGVNTSREHARIFEIANVYIKKPVALPDEIKTLCCLIKGKGSDFFDAKGIVEQIFVELGITDADFKNGKQVTADIFIGSRIAGFINILGNDTVVFELNFELLTKYATDKKVYKPASKYPAVVEDISLIIDFKYKTGDIIKEIKKQSSLISSVALLDKFEKSRTFHIEYQSMDRNLTKEEILQINTRLISTLRQKYGALLKS